MTDESTLKDKILSIKPKEKFPERSETALLTIKETLYRFGGSEALLRKQVSRREFPEAIVVVGKLFHILLNKYGNKGKMKLEKSLV
jgi:hypothetical protein